jgi:Fe-S-cluster-containing dehydrogenase component/anaerobic selenocysteine-containing dehydrogenase
MKTPHPQNLPENATDKLDLDRREFLRLSTAAAAAAALVSTGCQMPAETVVPAHERPEELSRLGKALFYATILAGRPALVRTREGRPILIGPNEGHPTVSTSSLRAQAAILDLYDPDRAAGPISVRRGQGAPTPSSWEHIGGEVVAALKDSTKRVVLLTHPDHGPGTEAALASLADRTGLEVVRYAPLAADQTEAAFSACFDGPMPRPRLDRASYVLGLGADFLDRPLGDEPLHFARRRAPDAEGGMSRFVALEGRLSLTGAAADARLRVRPSQLPRLAAALAREIIVQRGLGGLAGTAGLAAALQPFELDATAQAAGVEPAALRSIAEELAAAAGSTLVVSSETACAQPGGMALAVAVNLLNLALGAWGTTLEPAPLAAAPAALGSLARLGALVEEMKAGRVDMLLIHGVNPVYDAPTSLGFAEALSSVAQVVSLNDRIDETSAMADLLAPASHALEAWGDGVAAGGLPSIQQPCILPLLDTRGFLDIIVAWGASCQEDGPLVEAFRASRDLDGALASVHSPGYQFLRAALKRSGVAGPGSFDAFWNDTLRDGYYQPAAKKVQAPVPAESADAGEVPLAVGRAEVEPAQEAAASPAYPTLHPGAVTLLSDAAVETPQGLEAVLFPHYALQDGSRNNNGWLLEFPDPLSRISWSGWVAVAPRRFDEMGLENGDTLAVSVGGSTFELPAYRQAGMHNDVIGLPLGLGRSAVGLAGDGVGVNLFPAVASEGGRALRCGVEVSLRATGEGGPLPLYQGSEVIDRDRRPLVPATTLAAWKQDPSSGTEQPHGGRSINTPVEYPEQRWAMAVDLSKCNGCGMCSMACRGENNVPVVGEKGCIDRREMSWIRIDRYYDAPERAGSWPDSVFDGPLEVVEEPKVLFEPVMCQHCENAPCETVCPFAATMHSEDGLNQQVYNRCVGTFFCANNCPFKVRRFNWYDYSEERTSALFNRLVPIMKEHGKLNARAHLQMKNNPEVTVRSRGVMEKCSFCVQRIREARELAIIEGRDPAKLNDGEVKPACMEICPTGAIVFGDINDPSSRVAALAEDPRAMKLLELLEIRPSVSYLAKVRNEV